MKRLSGTDRELARRLELGHAHSGFAYIEGCEGGVAEQTEDGGWAMFQGAGRPATQALAVGMCGDVTDAGLDRIEAFFWSRGSAAVIDLCTLAEPSLMAKLDERGYKVREFSNVVARVVDRTCAYHEPEIHPVEPRDLEHFGRLVARGFMNTDEVSDEMASMVSQLPDDAHAFIASDAAAAMMIVHHGLATLTGDATLVAARGRGLQSSLIRHRLNEALERQCDLATASVLPGSGSHRNYERAGFELLYARVMLYRSAPLS